MTQYKGVIAESEVQSMRRATVVQYCTRPPFLPASQPFRLFVDGQPNAFHRSTDAQYFFVRDLEQLAALTPDQRKQVLQVQP
jgi:hypothetical protein